MLLINKTLLKMSKGIRHLIFIIMLLKLLATHATVEFAKILSVFLGDLFNPVMTNEDFKSSIISAFVISIILLAVNILLGEAEYLCSAKSKLHIRDKILTKIFEVDIASIESIGAVNTISLVSQGVENMQVYYSRYLPTLLFCIISPFYLFWQLSNISMNVAIILSIIAVLILPLSNVFKKLTEKLKGDYWNSMQSLTGSYLENLKGLTTLKLLGVDQDKSDDLREKAYDFNEKIMYVMKVNFYSVALSFSMIYLGMMIAIIIAYTELQSGLITVSSALTILMLSFGFFASFRDLMGASHSALTGIAVSEKIHDLFAIDTKRKEVAKEEVIKTEKIELRNVSYSYPSRKSTLKDLSLTIKKGKVTALVGSSGCGKSTISSLLLRFIDVDSGDMFFEGENYLSITPESIRKHISIVPQTVFIFAGTIYDNLKIANFNATESEMLKALENVHLLDWVMAQPNKLKTDIGDNGSKLSGGQKQKIGIARTLLSSSEYILFDEATSSVDMESEREIWNCINELSQRKTLIIISHRLSTIKNADAIYVIDKGTIENSGTHDELMQNSKTYQKLVNEQSVYENEMIGGV